MRLNCIHYWNTIQERSTNTFTLLSSKSFPNFCPSLQYSKTATYAFYNNLNAFETTRKTINTLWIGWLSFIKRFENPRPYEFLFPLCLFAAVSETTKLDIMSCVHKIYVKSEKNFNIMLNSVEFRWTICILLQCLGKDAFTLLVCGTYLLEPNSK